MNLRKIVGFEHYLVSDCGRIFNTIYRNRHTNITLLVPREVHPVLRPKGYRSVKLSDRSKYRCEFVHVLVMEAFVGPKPSGMETAHLDGNPANNRLSNLDYVTRAENASHRRIHGTLRRGGDAPMAAVTWDEADEIRALCAFGIPQGVIGDAYGLSPACVSLIHLNKTYQRLR